MNSYTEETYGERIAGVYDDWFPDHDAAAQRVVSQKVVFSNGQVNLYPIQIRYAWPSELDLMAQLA